MPNAEKVSSAATIEQSSRVGDWKPVASAPYGEVLEVRNEQMEAPCLATRGYVYNGAVHQNNKFFTTVYTPDRYFPTPAGHLCCPTEWRRPNG